MRDFFFSGRGSLSAEEGADLAKRDSTLLEPQSRFGDKPVKFQVVFPQNGTAVLKGLKAGKSAGRPSADFANQPAG